MSNEGKFRDYNGNVQTAGKITAIKDESGKHCINPNPTGRVRLLLYIHTKLILL